MNADEAKKAASAEKRRETIKKRKAQKIQDEKNAMMLMMIDSLSNERGVNKPLIFEAVEAALAAVTSKRYDEDVTIRVGIDRENGSYETFRCWTVDEATSEELIDFPGQYITLEKAKEVDSNLNLGDVIEELVDSVEFGRISAQMAKQVIIQKVREAERKNIVEQYADRVGELLIGIVKRVTREFLTLDMGDNAEALLERDNMMPREAYRTGDRIRVLLTEVREEKRGPQLMVSRTSADMLIELFKIEVPEIGEEVIEIKAAARDAGSRAKIAVKTNDGRIDPIGACVGMRGSRVQAVSNELSGERVDIVLWDDNPAQLVINAMAPAEVASIVVDEDAHAMDIAVEEEQLSQAIGRSGQNVRLASQLTGWTLNVMSEADAVKKQETEAIEVRDLFMDKLDVDEDIAEVLVQEGFASLEEVAFVDPSEMLAIEGFDEDIVEELQSRSKEIYEAEAKGKEGDSAESEGIMVVEGMTAELAEQFKAKEIITRDDLAELAVDELQEIVEMSDEDAAKLIMTARAHWFEEE